MSKPKFTIKASGSNPLKLKKYSHEEHLNHSKTLKACFECQNKRCFDSNKMLPCPQCGLFTLHLREFVDREDGYYMDDEAEIYCSACNLHWGRTRNW